MATILIQVSVPDDKLSELLSNAGVNVVGQAAVSQAPVAPAPQQQPPVYSPPWTDAAPPPDPWAQQTYTQQQATPSQYQQPAQQYQPQAQPSLPVPPGVPLGPTGRPVCAHGERKPIPAGVSKTGSPYNAFWACPCERNDPSKCKGLYLN